MGQHFLIPKSDNSVAKLIQFLSPGSIIFHLLIMNTPIEFNNEAMLRTVKINNKRRDRMLTAKPQALQLAIFESLPQSLFGRREMLSKLAGSRYAFRRCSPNASRTHQA